MSRIVVGLLLAAGSLCAEFGNLVASADGTRLYFEAWTSGGASTWFVARETSEGVRTEAVEGQIADVSATGAVMGLASYKVRYCGVAGSTCFLAATCEASFALSGVGRDVSGIGHRTTVRLDGSGRWAWIDQEQPCPSLGRPLPTPLNGLYETATMRQVAGVNFSSVASPRIGRRMVTDNGRVLTIRFGQLGWVDGGGFTSIRHVNGLYEAVTDASGENIVYGEEVGGELHWITGGEDYLLGLKGTAPALSADGLTMYYLDVEGALVRYDGVTNVAQWLGAERYQRFTLSKDAVFAVTVDERIVRLDARDGRMVWQLVMPQVSGFDAPEMPFSSVCPLYCYYQRPFEGILVRPGDRVRVFGRYLDQPGVRVRSPYMDVAVEMVSEKEARFDVPEGIPAVQHTIEFYHPAHTVRYQVLVGRR
ncbi:MAG: hypothetical protein JNL62_06200 [Bryobacterales bacterium]|nr:hypothetical protein [Bryobacterales bacterium]